MPHVAVALEMLATPCNEQIASKKCHLLAPSVTGKALEVSNKLFIDRVRFMAVDKIKKHLLGLTQSNILTLALISGLTLQVRAE